MLELVLALLAFAALAAPCIALVAFALPRRLMTAMSVMVAAPFKATVSVVDAKDNPVATYALSCSDVANAFATNDGDGQAYIELPETYPNGAPIGALYLGDLFLSASGTDTAQMEVWAGGFPTQHRLRNSAMSSATNLKRTPRIGFKPGRKVAFKQLA
jgi:hypothetical protein